jgi:hypothetical protein
MKLVTVFQDFVRKKEDISLDQIIADIKEGKYKKQVELIRNTIINGNILKSKELKKKLLAFTASGVFNNDRKSDNIVDYSGFIILDLDKLVSSEMERVISIIHKIEYTYVAFVSPSGNGIKILVSVNSTKEKHKRAYNQVVNYYQSELNVEIDTSGSDLSRLCYMSYDPNCYFNEKAIVFKVQVGEENKNFTKDIDDTDSNNSYESDIEKYNRMIEGAKTDITKNYKTWRNIGFAFSKEFGELGRDYFHRISKFYKGYNQEECDKQYTKCLNSKSRGINISTFYYLAHRSNIKPFNESDGLDINIEDEFNSNEDKMEVPPFPETLYPQLPKFLEGVIRYCDTSEEKDIMILGAITTLSSCFPNLYGIYDGDKIFSNLYLFVSAPPSAGKGKVNLCKRLVYPIHKSYNEEYKQLCQKHSGTSNNKEKSFDPVKKMLFIPANNSSTGIFELINNNEGKGLIFETEAETLANSFKTDYGNYSEGFRKAFHHETISYYRRTNKEHVDIDNPRLSTVLLGTPKQVILLMPNAENGLFSRFMFYYMKINPKWKNVFHKTYDGGLKDYFDVLGEHFYGFYQSFNKKGEIKYSYTKDQENEFSVFFSNLNSIYLSVNDIEYIATVRRMGLIAFRISMIFTVLRVLETDNLSKNLICSDIDFRNTLEIVGVLIKHSSKVYSSLPLDKSAIKYGNKKEQFLNKLPDKFTTKDYYKIAIAISISEKTAEGYITEFCKKEIIKRESMGKYINPAN